MENITSIKIFKISIYEKVRSDRVLHFQVRRIGRKYEDGDRLVRKSLKTKVKLLVKN